MKIHPSRFRLRQAMKNKSGLRLLMCNIFFSSDCPCIYVHVANNLDQIFLELIILVRWYLTQTVLCITYSKQHSHYHSQLCPSRDYNPSCPSPNAHLSPTNPSWSVIPVDIIFVVILRCFCPYLSFVYIFTWFFSFFSSYINFITIYRKYFCSIFLFANFTNQFV